MSVDVRVVLVLSHAGELRLVGLTVALGQFRGGGGLADSGPVAAVIVAAHGATVALLNDRSKEAEAVVERAVLSVPDTAPGDMAVGGAA